MSVNDGEPANEIAELANAACDDTLSAEQHDRLEQLLLGDEEAQLSYLCCLEVHAQLVWELPHRKNGACKDHIG